MQAIFRFRSSEEIEVFTDAVGVNVLHRIGVEPVEGGRYVKEERALALTKSQARSLASALMGAAAEI